MMDKSTTLERLKVAQEHFTQGREHIRQGRKILFEIEQGEGWKACGYSSMRQFIQGEMTIKKSQAYREIQAAQIEKTITGTVGELPERWLRELKDVKHDPILLNATHQIAQETAKTLGVKPSFTIYRSAAETAVEIARTGCVTVDEHQVKVTPQNLPKMELTTASTINKAAETLARQMQHIRDKNKPPMLKVEAQLKDLPGILQRLMSNQGDRRVKLVVYEVKDNGESENVRTATA